MYLHDNEESAVACRAAVTAEAEPGTASIAKKIASMLAPTRMERASPLLPVGDGMLTSTPILCGYTGPRTGADASSGGDGVNQPEPPGQD